MFTFTDFVTVLVILLCFCALVPSEGHRYSGKKRQSPIDIITTGYRPLLNNEKPLALEGWNTILSRVYKNTGHSVQFTPGSNHWQAAYISKGNQRYKVCQFHIHWGAHSNQGSEHLINSRAYSGELHIVSVKDNLGCGAKLNARDDALVVGVFLRAANTPIANTVWQNLYPVPLKYLQAGTAYVQLDQLLPADRSYFFYEGSLTTDPYNETVQWHVLKNPIEVPKLYLKQLRITVDENGKQILSNVRDVQPLNGRREELLHASTIV